MRLHPAVLQLSKRLWLFLPVAGAVALATNLLSLSHVSYPGYSAALVAEAAGLVPRSGIAHPLFSRVVQRVADLDVLSLIVRLNLFSAACGTLCAMLLYYLVGRTILFSACEDAGGGARDELSEEEDEIEASVLPPEVERFNGRVLKIAIAGGLVAAFLLTYMVPTWSAATRLDNGLLALLLALSSLCLFPLGHDSRGLIRLALSVVLFVLGLFDSAAFLLLLPCYAFLLFRQFLLSSQRAAWLCVLALAGLLGFALAACAYWLNTDGAVISTLRGVSVSYARALAHHHLAEVRSFFPTSGWLLVCIQVGCPAVILLFGQQVVFKEQRANALVCLFLLTLAAIPALLNLSFSPFFLYQMSGHLPVFGTAVAAVSVACVVAACLLVFAAPDERVSEADSSVSQEDVLQPRRGILKGVAGGLLPLVLLLALVTPFRSFRTVDARRGAFADRISREMLDAMKGRTCLVSNGLLDNHLLIQAHLLQRPITLVTLRPRPVPKENESMRRCIAVSPLFEGLNRQRLQNALSISTVRFVMEWFNTDPGAGGKAVLFAMPDIWTACGYRAIPEGVLFGGLRAGVRPDTADLVEQNRALVGRIAPLLAEQYPDYGTVGGLRTMLRMKAGFAANELGVLLEEQGEPEAAYASYVRSSAIDPQNVSAAINAYELTQLHKLHPEAVAMLKKRMKLAVASAHVRSLRDTTWILQNHGTIRKQEFYRQQTEMWSSLGARTIAADKIRKAQLLTERTGVVTLISNAALYLQSGDTAQAESCYLAVLEKDSANKDALSGLCMLMLELKKPQEAEAWLRKALDAGIDPLVLRYQTVTLAILKGETERVIKLLEAATREEPSDFRYWALLAEQLLDRGDIQFVERQLLPDMQRALKTADHFLLHAVRGMALRCKGPGFFREARLCLLSALSQNAAMPDIWSAVLKLDLAIGNSEFTEVDARKLLGVDPDHALANYLLGSSLLARGSLKESEDFLRRSTERQATAVAYNDLAENLRRQKRLPEAETAARKALALEPGLPPALDTLACILFDAGKYEESAQAAETAVAAKPAHQPYQLTLLHAQVRLGNKEGVRQRLEALSQASHAIPDALLKEINDMK